MTTRLRDVKFSKALQIILASVSTDTVKLGYTVDQGVITISTAEDLAGNTLTRVYDIRDLILQVPDFTDATAPSTRMSSIFSVDLNQGEPTLMCTAQDPVN